MKTLDMTPTIPEYTNMLLMLIESSTNPQDRAWARAELHKLTNAGETA